MKFALFASKTNEPGNLQFRPDVNLSPTWGHRHTKEDQITHLTLPGRDLEMTGLVPTLSSRISLRLNLLHKTTQYVTIRAFKALRIPSRPVLPPLSSAFPLNSSPPRLVSSYSNKSAAVQMQNPLSSDDNLVILGIETSCDDTAAAVVGMIFFWLFGWLQLFLRGVRIVYGLTIWCFV